MMENEPIKVMIVDDEKIVREGIRNLIDWEELGYVICAEAENVSEAFRHLKKYNPALILLDIRMPDMYGTEFIKKIRENGYDGKVIILSGYSDFSYAQTALRFGASYYITKPIDEEELTHALTDLRSVIISKKRSDQSMSSYRKKARSVILKDILTGEDDASAINLTELNLYAPIYQVVMYENYSAFHHSFDFADMLRTTNNDNHVFESLIINNQNIILLKGDQALNRFQALIAHYKSGTEKGSPLDGIFLVCGPTVSALSDTKKSYDICVQLMKRRFFCDENQHVLSYENLPENADTPLPLTEKTSDKYTLRLLDYIKVCNRRKIEAVIEELRSELYGSGSTSDEVRSFLSGLFLSVKNSITHSYASLNIPFDGNAAIIELIKSKLFLYEILDYYTGRFDMVIHAIGDSTEEGVIDEVIYYIDHNFSEQLRLDSISALFGYNSSYLGKLFTQKAGQNFNAYLDEVRIKESIKLLDTTDMKVYDISSRVGYSTVDYFHQKFKKRMNMSPAEYRKLNKQKHDVL